MEEKSDQRREEVKEIVFLFFYFYLLDIQCVALVSIPLHCPCSSADTSNVAHYSFACLV